MSNIIHLDQYRPYITIETEDSVHVLPLALLQSVAEGRISINQIDNYEQITSALVQVLLNNIDFLE